MKHRNRTTGTPALFALKTAVLRPDTKFIMSLKSISACPVNFGTPCINLHYVQKVFVAMFFRVLIFIISWNEICPFPGDSVTFELQIVCWKFFCQQKGCIYKWRFPKTYNFQLFCFWRNFNFGKSDWRPSSSEHASQISSKSENSFLHFCQTKDENFVWWWCFGSKLPYKIFVFPLAKV